MKDVKAIVEESAKSLATLHHETDVKSKPLPPLKASRCSIAYLSNAPDVLISIFLRKAQVPIQAKPNVVTVEAVSYQPQVQ